jgi:hypothetical protein
MKGEIELTVIKFASRDCHVSPSENKVWEWTIFSADD